MAVISWGKPKIVVGPMNSLKTANVYALLPTPAEDSTQLTGQTGEKEEAKIEGGEVEAVKNKAGSSELVMRIRKAQGRTLPAVLLDATTDDGYTRENVSLCLQPENANAPGFYCGEGSVSIIDTYTAKEGAFWEITYNPVLPSTGSIKKKLSWGTVTLTEGTSTNAGKYTLGGTALGDNQ